MDLPKENPTGENQLEGFVSKPDESSARAASQLEPLLNLLVELKIVAGLGRQNAESKQDGSVENGEAGILGGLNDLLGISESVAVNVKPQTPDPTPESGDSQAGLDELNSLRFVNQKLNDSKQESERYNSESKPDSSNENDRSGVLDGLKGLLGISESVAVNVKPQTPDPETESDDLVAAIDQFQSLLFVTQKLTNFELEKDYSSAKTIDVSAIDRTDLDDKSPSIQQLSNLTTEDNLQEGQRKKSESGDRNLEDLLTPETATKSSDISHKTATSRQKKQGES
jgi:hypothetical protein